VATACRYFFAIFPDAGAAAGTVRRAAELQKSLGLRGPILPVDQLHATWHFIGSYQQARPDIESAALAAGQAVACPPFELVFDCATSFGSNRRGAPFVLEALAPPAALMQVEQQLRESMSRAGALPEARPYRPHVTLSYSPDIVPGQVPVEPVVWSVVAFSLVRSMPGPARYEILHRWPLGSRA
jgi:2'-5' RNA ligase